MRWLVLLFPLLLFGVNEANKTNYFKVLQEKRDPYIFDKKARLELQKVKIEAETKKKIAEMEYKKAVDTKKIEKEAVEVKATKEVEKEKVAVAPKTLEAKALEKMALYALLFGLAALIIGYLVFKRYQAYKKELELERLRAEKEAHEKELMMKEKEIQAQMAGKLIDAIASGKLSKEQEEKLLKIASGGSNLLEDKR